MFTLQEKGAKSGGPFVNCQIIVDEELVKLAFEVEGQDFTSKMTYNTESADDLDGWFYRKTEEVRGQMTIMRVALPPDVLIECLKRMLVPMRMKVASKNPKKLDGRGGEPITKQEEAKPEMTIGIYEKQERKAKKLPKPPLDNDTQLGLF